MKKFNFLFSLFMFLMLCVGQVWGKEATYAVSSKSSVTSSNVPSGSSATYSQTYNTVSQATKNNSFTLTLSGYEGYKITGITLSMKSNSSGGSGSLSVVAGETTICSISDSKFNSSNWYGSWSTAYVDITPTMEDDSYEIQEGEKVVLTISATANSLFFQSCRITYEVAGSTCETLAAPANPSSTPTQKSVELSWDAVSGAEGYVLTFSGTKYNIVSGTTTKTINGLAEDTEYKWTVAAVGDGTTYCEDGTPTAQQTAKTLSDCSGSKAVYTVKTASSVTATGAPQGASATFANTYTSNKEQMTKDNSQTLSLTGYAGKSISGLTLFMHSNASAGAGKFKMTVGTKTVAEIASATTFNKWFDNTSYGSDYRNVHVDFDDDVAVGENETIEVVITATTNSLFCQSFTFCYITTPATSVAKPTISGTDNFYPSTEVTLDCSTEDATIYYTTNATAGTGNPSTSSPWVAYDPLNKPSFTETTTVYAAAKKGNDWSAVAKATFNKLASHTTIASFITAASDNASILSLTDAIITGVDGTTLYVQDKTAGIMIYGLTSLPENAAPNHSISGSIIGKYSLYKDQHELVKPNSSTPIDISDITISTDEVSRPAISEYANLADAYTDRPMMLITLKDVYYQASSSYIFTPTSGGTGDGEKIFNTFGVLTDKTMPESTDKCAITGVVVKYNGTLELMPVFPTDIVVNKNAQSPTFDPEGGEDAASAKVTNAVTVTPANNTKVNGSAEAVVVDITSTTASEVSVEVTRDFYRTVTVSGGWYKSANVKYAIKGQGETTEGSVLAKVDDVAAETAVAGAEVHVHITVEDHYHFASIKVNDGAITTTEVAAGQEYTFAMPAEEVTIAVTYTQDPKFALTFKPGEATGGSAPEISGNTYYAGELITLPANTFTYDDEHKFNGWKIGETTYSAGSKYTMTAEATEAVAQWKTLPNYATGDWMLVKDAAELTAGSYVIIAASDAAVAMKSWESGNNCKGQSATKTNNALTFSNAFGVFAIDDYEIDDETYKTFYDVVKEQYLFLGANNNYLKAQDAKDVNAAWIITSVSGEGVAVVTSKSFNDRSIRYNGGSNNLFACYGSSNTNQKHIVFYKYNAPVPKITYDKNTSDEVSNLPAPQRAELSDGVNKATVAEGASRTGYTFTGWNTEANGSGTSYNAGTEYTFTADVTLYAQWEPLPVHHVTYVTTGASGTTPVDAANYYEGDEVTLASATGLSNPGHFFNGWAVTYIDGDDALQTIEAEDGKFAMPDFDVTITATWARKSDDKWVKVASTDDLEAGNEVIIVNADATYAIGEQKTNNRAAAAVENNNGVLTISSAVKLFTIGVTESGEYTFKNGSKYLYASSNTKNYLNEQTTNDANGIWTIAINGDGVATIIATGTNSHKDMRFNLNNGSPLFACYSSSSEMSKVALYKKAPKVEINDGEDTNSSDLPAGTDVTVKQGGTLTVDASKTVGDLNVAEGAKVVLSGEINKLTVTGELTISSKMAGGKSSQFIGASNNNIILSEGVDVFFDITLGANGTGDQWHAFTVPFPVDAMNGVFDLDGNKLTNEVNYAIMDYHGDIRAEGKYGWKKFRGIMTPGTFYLMTVDGERTTYRFKKVAGSSLVAAATKELHEYASGTTTDAGWNGVGNPTLSYGKVDYVAYVLNPNTYTYEDFDQNSTNFVVGTPFFIQADADGEMSMLAASGTGAYAPARATSETAANIKVLFGNDEYKDRLSVSADEDARNEYQIGKDLVKMTMTNTPRVAQIFAKAYGTNLSRVYAPMANNQASYDLKLYAPEAGEYTIEATNAGDADLYLTRNGAILWNIALSPYTLDLTKGNTEGYGLLLQARAPQIVTGIDDCSGASAEGSNVQKVILNEHVYILRDGQLYDVTGKLAK